MSGILLLDGRRRDLQVRRSPLRLYLSSLRKLDRLTSFHSLYMTKGEWTNITYWYWVFASRPTCLVKE